MQATKPKLRRGEEVIFETEIPIEDCCSLIESQLLSVVSIRDHRAGVAGVLRGHSIELQYVLAYAYINGAKRFFGHFERINSKTYLVGRFRRPRTTQIAFTVWFIGAMMFVFTRIPQLLSKATINLVGLGIVGVFVLLVFALVFGWGENAIMYGGVNPQDKIREFLRDTLQKAGA